jgi:AcrR family transcriptional regulator
LSAGREAFAQRGYAGSRLADIAGAAGLTTGAFYRHFPSKADFFTSLFSAYGEDLLAALRRARTLRAQLEEWLLVAREHRGVMRAAQELAVAGTAEAELRRQLREDVAALLGQRLDAAVPGLADLGPAARMLADIVSQYALTEAAGWIPQRDAKVVAVDLERLAKHGLYRK